MLNISTIHAAADVANLNSTVIVKNIDNNVQLDQLGQPRQHDAVSFEALLESALTPINQANNHIYGQVYTSVNEIDQTSGIFEPSELAAIQQSTNRLVVSVTIASKAANLGIKFINELTHLQ